MNESAGLRGGQRGELQRDLSEVLELTQPVWAELAQATLFISGGTGFIGQWLLQSLALANERLGAKVSATLLTRDPHGFARRQPELATQPWLTLIAGDVRNFAFPPDAKFSHIIHAAAPGSPRVAAADDGETLSIGVKGTARVLELARQSGARRFLLTSSGAVYGPRDTALGPVHLTREDESATDTGAPGPRAAYAEGKRMAERLCLEAGPGLQSVIARCFSVLGPYLPLEGGYAAGDFIRDALSGGPIRIQGDGTPFRSYLHPVDLVSWLWTLLARGAPGRAYNVGSERAIHLSELAQRIGASLPGPTPRVVRAREPSPGNIAQCYVPSTQRIRDELGVRQSVNLDETVARTVHWFQEAREPGPQRGNAP